MPADKETRDAAAKALIKIFEATRKDSPEEMDAIRALGRNGSQLAIEKLEDIWKKSSRGSEREKEVTRALGEIGREP